MMRAPSALREYFLMKEAVRTSNAIDDLTRSRATGSLLIAMAKRKAAEALDASGMFTEAFRLTGESAEALRQSRATLEPSGWRPSARADRAAVALTKELDEATRDDAAPVRRARLGRALRLIDTLSAELSVATRDSRQLARVRVRRWLDCAALVVGIVFMARVAYEAIYGVRIRASSELNATWSADRAIDGDKDTDWVSADQNGWIELRFHASRTFRHVRIRNGEFFPDRGVKDFKVELFDADAMRWSAAGTFAHTPSETVTVNPEDVQASRIRITAVTHFGVSPAISEITWD